MKNLALVLTIVILAVGCATSSTPPPEPQPATGPLPVIEPLPAPPTEGEVIESVRTAVNAVAAWLPEPWNALFWVAAGVGGTLAAKRKKKPPS